jgi:hypothetical protein
VASDASARDVIFYELRETALIGADMELRAVALVNRDPSAYPFVAAFVSYRGVETDVNF